MIKKLLGSGIVAAMMLTSVLSAFPATAASDSLMFGDFEYTPRNTYVEINAYKGTDTTVEIPSEINGLEVRQIASNGLCGNESVEKYILPEGITTIGQHALSQNTNLKEISFPSTLKSVQFGAISYDNALEVVNFPEGLETIEGCVLYTCYGLTDVYIPSTVTSITENMFCSSSYSLEEFHVDDNNDSYCSVNGVIFTKDMTKLVRYPLNKAETVYEIPTTVTEIAPSAFDTVKVLEKLEIPDNVKTIGERAFSMATLKELKLPHELTVLPQYCIGSMHKLEKLYIPKSLTTMGNVACTFFDVMPTIYYEGTEEEWKSIEIGSMNADFSSLEFVYNYDYDTDISEFLMGDVNDDGAFNVSDVVLLQKWLLAVPDTHLANWRAADFCEDEKLDVFDLCLMKRELIEQSTQMLPENNYNYNLLRKYDNLTRYNANITKQSEVSEEIPIPTETEPIGWYESQYEISIDRLPDKVDYALGEELDFTGLRVSLILYDQHGKKNIVFDNVDPMEYTDAFTVDNTAFDTTQVGTYSIAITTTDLYRAFLDTETQKFSVYVNNQEYTKGDVNDDGAFNVSDVVLLQKWLLAVPDMHLASWKAADFCEDNKFDVFDLCLMKRALIEQHQQRQITVDDIVSLFYTHAHGIWLTSWQL